MLTNRAQTFVLTMCFRVLLSDANTLCYSLISACLVALQKDTIRDLSTGQLFALNKSAELNQVDNGTEGSSHHYTDFTSGKQLSLDEFDIALGIKQKVSTSLSLLTQE